MSNQNTPNADDVVSSRTLPLPARRQIQIPAGRRPAPSPSVSLDGDDDSTAAPVHTHAAAPESPQPGINLEAPVSTKRYQHESDPDLTSVELPSAFYFYPFKELALRNIRVKHQAKFARSAKEQSTRITVEAVSSLIGDNISAMDMTIQDFYWVLYWLRMNNFAKTPYTNRAKCSDPKHTLAVAEGTKSKESLFTIDVVNRTTLKEVTLDVEKLTTFLATVDLTELTSKGFTLTAPIMADMVAVEEDWADRKDFSDMEFLVDAATCIRPIDGPQLTLQERVDLIGEMLPETNDAINEFRLIVESYGVQEKFQTKCKECGAAIETEVSINAYNFL